MKLHWGHGIVAGGLLFMTFIMVMVVNMSRQEIDLVAPDYYEKGIQYQHEIENQRLARHDIVVARYEADGLRLSAINKGRLPAEVFLLSFYRPSDKEADFEAVVKGNGMESILFTDKRLSQGLWKLKISWLKDKQEQFTEMEVYRP